VSTAVNINGIHEIEFASDGNTSAEITAPGVVTLTSTSPLTVVFSISNGTIGSNISLYGIAPRAGSVTKCSVVVTKSDPAATLVFTITLNGMSVFSSNPSIIGGVGAGTTYTFTTLTSLPLSIAQGDVFNMNILSGGPSWEFTAQLE